MEDSKLALCLVAGVAILAIVYIASEESGTEDPGKELSSAANPAVAMAYNALDFGAPFVQQNMLDMDHRIHGWHPGYDPVPGAQESIASRHRYPIHCGGNLTATMVRGMNPLLFPDLWGTSPPSEVDM